MARMRKKKNLVSRTEACAEHFFEVPQDNRGKWRTACGMPEDSCEGSGSETVCEL